MGINRVIMSNGHLNFPFNANMLSPPLSVNQKLNEYGLAHGQHGAGAELT